MSGIIDLSNNIATVYRLLVSGLLVGYGLLFIGCSLNAGSQDKNPPILVPYAGAPVTASVDGRTLVIANNSPDPIYHLIFPAEILPVIEWAPCMAPEVCPAEQRIDPGDAKQVSLRTVVNEDTETLAVFWWQFLERRPGAGIPPMELEEISVALP